MGRACRHGATSRVSRPTARLRSLRLRLLFPALQAQRTFKCNRRKRQLSPMADTLLPSLKLRLTTRSHTKHFLVLAKNDISTLDLRACGKSQNCSGLHSQGPSDTWQAP